MNKNVDLWIDAHREQLIKEVQTLIGFKSVSEHCDMPGAPFGMECKKALDYTLGICDRLGFSSTNMEGYIGFADYGTGDETLGILTHLDVVPEGEGWRSDPYAANIIDGYMVGRGIMDDKGPALASIYALAAVKECGFEFSRRVRLIFGCDEESGMGCLNHYLKTERPPELVFSPDGEYPLVSSEKHIYHGSFENRYSSKITMRAGTVVNAVPGTAEAVLPLCPDTVRAAIADETEFTVVPVEGGCKVIANGTAAHASLPELGKNAVQMLLGLFVKLPLDEADAKAAGGLYDLLHMDYNGEGFGLDVTDDSGRLTFNLGLMEWDETGYSLSVDSRVPISLTEEETAAKYNAGFEKAGAKQVSHTFSKGHLVPEDSELVTKLLGVYRARTGDMTPPMHIGGGTYARHFDNGVAFGVERAYRVNRLHMVDEDMCLDDLIEDTKIMADAIIALACK